jgi:hypothetical protein
VGQDVERLKRGLPLLKYLQQQNWTGQRAGRFEYVGLCPLHLEPSTARKRWWTGLNFTFQTNGQTKKPLLCLESSPKITTNLSWLKAWKAHGDENKLQLSSARSSASRVLSKIAC